MKEIAKNTTLQEHNSTIQGAVKMHEQKHRDYEKQIH